MKRTTFARPEMLVMLINGSWGLPVKQIRTTGHSDPQGFLHPKSMEKSLSRWRRARKYTPPDSLEVDNKFREDHVPNTKHRVFHLHVSEWVVYTP